jgi:bacterioferritin-associated ferredoxin
MGNMEGTCGALVGAGLVLGLVNKDKVKSMKQMRQVMNKFQERNGSTQCKQLKGVGTKVVLRNCPDCVADAAEFLEEQLSE